MGYATALLNLHSIIGRIGTETLTVKEGSRRRFSAPDFLRWLRWIASYVRPTSVCFTFCAIISCQAKDWYIADHERGSADGMSAEGAKSYEFFNSPENWGSGPQEIGAGDTVHLTSVVSHQLIFQGDGVLGSPITLLFSPGAKLSSAAWSGNEISTQPGDGAIVLDHRSFITINGDISNERQGLIENTANGTELANQTCSVFINATSCSYLTVKNLTLQHIYRRTKLSDTKRFGVGVLDNAKNGVPFSHFSVVNCLIDDAYIGIWSDIPNSNLGIEGINWSRNTIRNVNWGCAIGDRGSGLARHIMIHDNRISGFEVWDEPAEDRNHHNGVFAFCVNGGRIDQLSIYNNFIGPGFGHYATAGVYLEGNVNALIFNNTFLLGAGDAPDDGAIAIQNRPGCEPLDRIYNNTVAGGGDGIGIYANADKAGVATIFMANNLVTNVATNVAIFSSGLINVSIDYDLFFHAHSGTEFSYSTDSSAGFLTSAQWQSAGFDHHGLFTNPKLDDALAPQAASPALGRGENKSQFFQVDRMQRVRPNDAPWSIGAVEFPSALSKESPPASHGAPP